MVQNSADGSNPGLEKGSRMNCFNVTPVDRGVFPF